MSGEDKAVGFFGNHIDSLKAFERLKIYIDDFCPDAVISIQGSLLSFRTRAGFAYVSIPTDDSGNVLFNLALTNRKKITSSRIDKTVPPVPGTSPPGRPFVRSPDALSARSSRTGLPPAPN